MQKKLLIGLHKDQLGRFDPYLQISERILTHNNIKHLRLEASQPDFWEIVARLDLIIFHWVYIDRDQQMAETLIPILEKEMGIKCFPNWSTFWHYNNKIKQYYLLKNHSFPIIESYPFWDKNAAKKWVAETQLPLVFKLSRGALSEDVILVRERRHAIRLIGLMFGKGVRPGSLPDSKKQPLSERISALKYLAWTYKQKLFGKYLELRWQKEKDYAFFQKFLPDNQYTTRVTIIGNRAFCFAIKTVKGDFRACDMQHITYEKELIDEKCISIAFDISKTLEFQCMSYDFLVDENNEPRVCEMGYTAQAHDIFKCDGFWDSSLSWHAGHFWPQYCQLIDLLDYPELKQPEIDFDSLDWS